VLNNLVGQNDKWRRNADYTIVQTGDTVIETERDKHKRMNYNGLCSRRRFMLDDIVKTRLILL